MNERLEVGMHVRTIWGIAKITDILKYGKRTVCYVDKCFQPIDQTKCYDEDVIKASYNIIDLIEVGDYVNGYRVLEVCTGNFELNNPLNVKALKLEFIKEDINPNIPFFKRYVFIINDEIKTIVTKEQFESIRYEAKND